MQWRPDAVGVLEDARHENDTGGADRYPGGVAALTRPAPVSRPYGVHARLSPGGSFGVDQVAFVIHLRYSISYAASSPRLASGRCSNRDDELTNDGAVTRRALACS